MFRHVTSHRLKHAAGLVLCGWATGVLCQTPYSPPPRSVDDVLAVLEQYKPDPAAIEKARRTAAQEPPSNASPRELSIFFHKRGRAALELGNLAQEISDYRKALDYDPPNQAVEAGGVGAKVWILQDLAIAERDSGNLLNARQAREQILRLVQQTSSMTVAAHKNIATTHRSGTSTLFFLIIHLLRNHLCLSTLSPSW